MINTCNTCLFQDKVCICSRFWHSFDQDFKKKYVFVNVQPTAPKISTMTFNWRIKDAIIDLNGIRNHLSDKRNLSLFVFEYRYKPESKKSKVDKKINDSFYNQGSITSFVPSGIDPNTLSKVSTKIFRPGSFNVTGCKSIKHVVHMVRTMLAFLERNGFIIRKIDVPLCIDIVRVSMINANFSLGFHLNRNQLKIKLHESMEDENGFDDYKGYIRYMDMNADRSKALILKYVRKCSDSEIYDNGGEYKTRKGVIKNFAEATINVFFSGNIIINGGCTSTDTMSAYEFICQYISDRSDVLKARTVCSHYGKSKSKSRIEHLRSDKEAILNSP